MYRNKKPIRLFFSRRRDGRINFGDDISPILVSHISARPVEHARVSQCDYTAIGSILEMIAERRVKRWLHGRFAPIRIWGSGCLRDGQSISQFLVQPLALRGPLSRDRMHCSDDLPLGDPGILFNRLYEPSPAKKYRWGVIAHYADVGSPILGGILDSTPKATRIPLDIDPLETLRLIGHCEHIASFSLHGLVSAECFGIPNWRISFDWKLDGGDFKFHDYCKSVGRQEIFSAPVPKNGNLDQLLRNGYPDFSYMTNLEAVGSLLEQALIEAV